MPLRYESLTYACPHCACDFYHQADAKEHRRIFHKGAEMKVDQEVSFVDVGGNRHVARVTGISGVGRNNTKKLNLSYKSGGEVVSVEDVPYQDDLPDGKVSGFWLLKGQRLSRPRVEALAVSDPTPKKSKKSEKG